MLGLDLMTKSFTGMDLVVTAKPANSSMKQLYMKVSVNFKIERNHQFSSTGNIPEVLGICSVYFVYGNRSSLITKLFVTKIL